MTAAPSTPQPEVVVGVDAHKDAHHAAVLTSTGELLGDKQFEVSSAGYRQLQDWAAGFGEVAVFAVESTGSYAAGLAPFLVKQGCDVREVNTPHAHAKPRRGKTDVLDAEACSAQSHRW